MRTLRSTTTKCCLRDIERVYEIRVGSRVAVTRVALTVSAVSTVLIGINILVVVDIVVVVIVVEVDLGRRGRSRTVAGFARHAVVLQRHRNRHAVLVRVGFCRQHLFPVARHAHPFNSLWYLLIIIIIIIKFFNKKVVKRNFTNGEENRPQIIVSNNVYTKLLSRNVVRSDR